MSSPKVQWKLCWENELQLSDHLELAQFFRATYGPTGPFNAKRLRVVEVGPGHGPNYAP